MSQRSLERAIPVGDRLLLDTATLIAYFDGRGPVSPVATHVIDTFVGSGRNQALVSMVTVMEVLVRPLRSGARDPYRHVMDFLTSFPNLRLAEIDLFVAQEAASQRAAHNFSAPDALIIATGVINQVSHLVTNDDRWAQRLRSTAGRIAVCTLLSHLPFP